MKTVTKTALANVKQNKGRNFLCGCAIALTTFLIFVVLTVGYGMIRVRLASVDAYYPTYHIMFRQVSEKNTKALQVHNDIEEIGLRMDLGHRYSSEVHRREQEITLYQAAFIKDIFMHFHSHHSYLSSF